MNVDYVLISSLVFDVYRLLWIEQSSCLLQFGNANVTCAQVHVDMALEQPK